MRPSPVCVRLPSGTRYWTVIDDDLRPVPVADAYLRHVRFGRDDAESMTKSYAWRGGAVFDVVRCSTSGLVVGRRSAGVVHRVAAAHPFSLR